MSTSPALRRDSPPLTSTNAWIGWRKASPIRSKQPRMLSRIGSQEKETREGMEERLPGYQPKKSAKIKARRRE